MGDSYKCLGLVLTEHLSYKTMADHVARSASRALGLVIAKSKAYGGMPYNCYKHLFDCLVWPVFDYGASIWGTQNFSSVNAVHNCACRYFMGVGKYTPNHAVIGDIGWVVPEQRQWRSVTAVSTGPATLTGSK